MISFNQTPQNFLASLLAKPAQSPFKVPPQQSIMDPMSPSTAPSVALKPASPIPTPQLPSAKIAAATPPSPAPAPGTPPALPTDPGTAPGSTPQIDAAAKAVASATAARQAYQPYEAQAVPLNAPADPKVDPKRAAIDMIAGLLLSRRSPRAAEAIGENLNRAQVDAKDQYGRDLHKAESDQATRQAAETATERQSTAHEHELDVGIDLAQKNQKELIDAHDREVKADAAQRTADFRANYYAQQVINSHQDRVGKIDADAIYHAQQIGVQDKRIAASYDLRRMSDATAMAKAGIGASTALQVASQRNNIALAIESLKEQSATANQDKRLAITTAMTSAKTLLTSYDAAIKAASNPLATPAQKAQAAALLANDPKTGMSPYQSLTTRLQSTVGVSVPEGQDVKNLGDIRSTIISDVMSGVDPTSAMSGYGGYGGGAPPINVTVNTPGAQQPPAGGTGGGGGATFTQPPVDPALDPTGGGSALAPAFATFSSMYGLPPGLLAAVISKGEASGPTAISPTGNKGVAQLSDELIKEYGISDPFNPAQSINGGARYLATLLKQFHNNPVLAVAAYNAGPGAVQRAGGDLTKLPAETQAYVTRVLGAAAQPGGVGGGMPQQPHQPAQPPHAPPPPPPPPRVATPQQVGQAATQMYDKGYAGVGFDAAWGAISQKLTAAGATPQDLQAAQQAVRQHVQQTQAAAQKQQVIQQRQDAVAQLAKAAGVRPGTPAYNNFMQRPDIKAFLAGQGQTPPPATPRPQPTGPTIPYQPPGGAAQAGFAG